MRSTARKCTLPSAGQTGVALKSKAASPYARLRAKPDGAGIMAQRVAIHSLHIYPVKSCRGVVVESAHAGALGLDMDRRWMLVDDLGRCQSLHNQPLLSHIQPAINHRGFSLSYLHESIPRLFIPPEATGGEKVQVHLAGDSLTAYRVGNQADRWFSGILGRPCHLVWLGPDSHRSVAPPYGKPGDSLAFAEAYPYLIASQASLEALNRKFAHQGLQALSMACFRPNIVLSRLPAFGEERFRSLRAGGLEFELIAPCAHEQPLLETLWARGSYPAGQRALPESLTADRGLHFGMYALLRGEGELTVGMEMEALERTDQADR
jgi:uncharacterized protein YcbX